ncbi:MAG: bacteriohemerythrin [Terracidiphilus sp.]
MPLIVWTDQMCVGVKLLDNDHKKLVLLINELHDGIVNNRDKQALDSVFESLVKFTRVHFAHEEQLLFETGYPAATAHKQEHESMTQKIDDLQARFRSGAPMAMREDGVELLKSWLFSHMYGADQEYAPYLEAKGVNSILTSWEIPIEVMQEKPGRRPKVKQRSRPA